MADIDSLFDLIAGKLVAELNSLAPTDLDIKHWVVVDDAVGVAISIVGEEPNPHEVLGGLIDDGASGAAYATYNPGAAVVVASALVSEPENSDIRRAYVVRADEGISLGPWEYTV